MTNEELIAALRGPIGKLTGAKLHDAADRLEALTQPSGKVSEEQVRAGVFRAITALPNDAVGILNKKPFGVTLESVVRSILEAALEAAQLSTRPKVKPLRWTVSEVFGASKIRGSGPFGEWCAFTIDGLTDQEVSKKKAKYQAGYERTILSALEGEGHDMD